MTQAVVICAYCGKGAMKEARDINRASRSGLNLYCDRACAGMGKRVEKPFAQRKEEKAEYDRRRRAELADRLKSQKAAYHKRTYDPAKAREERKLTMPRHVEYCRRPEYRKKKASYDRCRRAKLQFGEFWESALLLEEIESEVLKRSTRYDIDMAKGALNKKKRRSRDGEIPLSR